MEAMALLHRKLLNAAESMYIAKDRANAASEPTQSGVIILLLGGFCAFTAYSPVKCFLNKPRP